MRHLVIILMITGLLGCGPSGDKQATNQPAAAGPSERTPYCFFKEAEAKGWSAAPDSQGNVVVKGKLYREDPRYKAILEKPKIEGTTAEIWPNIAQNDTGYAADDNWWNVTLTIPGSTAVTRVDVRCGAKTFASIDVKRKN